VQPLFPARADRRRAGFAAVFAATSAPLAALGSGVFLAAFFAAFLAAFLAASLGGVAHASPLDDAHVGGIGFGGPTNDDLSAIFWNPAALGLQTGTRGLVVLGGQRGSLRVSRDPIDPVTGYPAGTGTRTRSFAPVTGQSNRLPTSLFGPGGFIASAQSVGSRVTFAAGVFTPFTVRLAFPGTTDGVEPARYHAVQSDLSSVALAPGLAIRLGGGIRVGVAPTFMLSRGSLTFDYDTGSPSGGVGAARLCGNAPCGAENPAAAARYALVADTDLLDSNFSFTLGAGIHLQRPSWSAGFTFITPPLDRSVELEGRSTSIQPPSRLGSGTTVCPIDFDPCITSRAAYRLPMMVMAAFQRQLSSQIALVLQARWLDLSVHDAVRVRLIGPAGGGLRGFGLPDQLVLHRGLQDTFDLRVRGLFRLGNRVDLSTTIRGETAATARRTLSPATMGGALIEPAVGVRVFLRPWITLSAGYAIAFAPTIHSQDVLDDPGASLACEATGSDLASTPCQKRQQGLARPIAAGGYSALTHAFSLGLSLQRLTP
jgi:long-subunit fatty acid transport protein